MIKNWTVKTKQIKKKHRVKKNGKATGKIIKSSAINYCNYLLDQKAKSHADTEIIDLNKSVTRLAEIENQFTRRKLHRMTEGLRGGGINCEATSFVLSIPKDIKQPSAEEWKKISLNVLSHLKKLRE